MARRPSATAIVLLIALGGCNSPAQPTGPTPPGTQSPIPPASVHPLTGMWIGTAQALTCNGVACSSWVTYPLAPTPFNISIVEGAGRFSALLDIDVRVHIVIELTGAPQPDGSIVFSGSARPPAVPAAGTSDMHRFEVRLNPATGLAGDFAYTLFWSYGTTDVTGRIVSAKRTLESPSQGCGGSTAGSRGCFGGAWRGGFVVKTIERCEGNCALKVGADFRLELTLSESNGNLSGDALAWSRVPVTGQSNRGSGLLDGQIGPMPCGYPGFDVTVVCSEVIEKLSVSLDEYGRMVGTLRYAREGWNGSSGGTQHYSLAFIGELWNVVRTQ